MPDYVKPAVFPAWAESELGNPANFVQPSAASVQAGWALSPIPPPRQYWNWFQNYVANGVRYFMQMGLAEYDAAETYRDHSRVVGPDDLTYRCIVSTTTGVAPGTNPAIWERWGFSIPEISAAQLTQPTQAHGDNSTKVATTAFVQDAFASGAFDPTAINNHLALLDSEVSTIQGVDTTQNAHLSSLDNEITTLNGDIVTINNTDNTQNGRLNAVESVNASQQSQINSILAAFVGLGAGSGYFSVYNSTDPTHPIIVQFASGFSQVTGNGVTQQVNFAKAFPNNLLSINVSTNIDGGTFSSGKPQSYGKISNTLSSVTVGQLRGDGQGNITCSPTVWAIGN
jgi:hypothetical protein